jgi:hypothetical protein
MGEIKSTLDLVLEKTKNLTLSSEEKEQQKLKEIESRIKGMLQKYQDGVLTQSQLKADYEILKKDFSMSKDDALINEITGRIEPIRDNELLLEVLRECCGIDSAAIETIIADFKKGFFLAEKTRMAQLKNDLAQQHAIAGSAVVPNLDNDEQWRREMLERRARFDDQLNRVKKELKVA